MAFSRVTMFSRSRSVNYVLLMGLYNSNSFTLSWNNIANILDLYSRLTVFSAGVTFFGIDQPPSSVVQEISFCLLSLLNDK